MIYERPQEEHASESNASNEPGQDEDRDASEESTTEEVSWIIPLRRSTRQKCSAPHCYLCDLEIREECDGYAWKRLRNACVCASAGHTFEDDTIE